jgi:hypothetical protein
MHAFAVCAVGSRVSDSSCCRVHSTLVCLANGGIWPPLVFSTPVVDAVLILMEQSVCEFPSASPFNWENFVQSFLTTPTTVVMPEYCRNSVSPSMIFAHPHYHSILKEMLLPPFVSVFYNFKITFSNIRMFYSPKN